MKTRDFATVDDAIVLEKEVRAAAAAAVAHIRELVTAHEPLQVLASLKFERSGRDPLDPDRPLNLIEQLNQTFTYLVSLRAVEFLFGEHPDAAAFRLNLGTAAGSDVESVDGSVAAEVFAAVDPRNNRKLAKDVAKVAATDADHCYVFFFCPGEHEASVKDGVRIIPLALDGALP